MNRSTWIQLERWYTGLPVVQKWLVNIGILVSIVCTGMVVTHEPSARPQKSKIILNCDLCGTDPERTMTYNEYMNQKQQQQIWSREQKRKQIQQDIWDEKGRQRWCRNHPHDRNCK